MRVIQGDTRCLGYGLYELPRRHWLPGLFPGVLMKDLGVTEKVRVPICALKYPRPKIPQPKP